MKLKNVNSAYFLGIGGIGMSALARWFNHNGVKVYGYDKTSTELTDNLIKEGISVHFEDEIDRIPEFALKESKEVIIIYTPAIPTNHKGFNHLKGLGLRLYKRAEVLGLITKGMQTVAVAGTHGKTTTSSMIAHLLKHADKNVAAFLGGIATNYNSNVIYNTGAIKKAIMVVEADEFDRSFLTLHPDIAVVTSTDADHLDIYGELKELRKSFALFLENVAAKGHIYIKEGLWEDLETQKVKADHLAYGMNSGEIRALNVKVKHAKFEFDVAFPNLMMKGFQLAVPGFHNVENAVVAISVAHQLGLPEKLIKSGIASYQGVKRRFEYICQEENFVYIDDYAHHPSEIRAMLTSVRALYPNKKVSVLFQPHLYSRTRDFAAGFAESLSLADEVMLMDIYPAREEPIEGVNSEMLLSAIQIEDKYLLRKEQIIDHLNTSNLEVFITMGAGDIDKLVGPIKEMFRKKNAA